MKEIKLTEKNYESIAEAIAVAEGRATERKIIVLDIIEASERILTSTLKYSSKKSAIGMKATIDKHAQHFANAHHFTPESTHFTIAYHSGSWYVTNISRDRCHRNANQEYSIHLTDAQKSDLAQFTIQHLI